MIHSSLITFLDFPMVCRQSFDDTPLQKKSALNENFFVNTG